MKILKNLSQIAIYTALTKMLVFGTSYAEALGFLVFCSYLFLKEHYNHSMQVEEFYKRLEVTEKQLEQTNASLSALKLSQNMRQMNGR